ncbi:nucleolar [Xylona heveae TC161]|uniref:Nucleolar n=1 Tax=Xylona heveae (strain CBS 132557 / TC161) TaxID=1328760 RepID=A0A165JL85_XYLHT|nr:nucleolar [Xylona heveae TC161]KZF26379.1 nucleolar [Xylona heveae TC161]
MAGDVQQAPFVKQLAANDRPTRDKAVASLRTYLSGRKSFEEIELLKLWKGLFFCMWMSDRPRTQQQLAIDLAGLVDVLPDETALAFLEAFWKTMSREWTGIDVLRMDKFLMLVRAYLNASFRYLAKIRWESRRVEKYMDILSELPFNCTDPKIPNGLRFHAIDIYVDEIDKVDTPRSGNIPLDQLLQPLRKLQKDCPTKVVRTRAKEALSDERLNDWENPDSNSLRDEAEDDASDSEWGGIDG